MLTSKGLVELCSPRRSSFDRDPPRRSSFDRDPPGRGWFELCSPRRADLENAHLEGADLENAHLEGADLREAHLEMANLRFAHLQGAYLYETNLTGIVPDRKTDFKNSYVRNPIFDTRIDWKKLKNRLPKRSLYEGLEEYWFEVYIDKGVLPEELQNLPQDAGAWASYLVELGKNHEKPQVGKVLLVILNF